MCRKPAQGTQGEASRPSCAGSSAAAARSSRYSVCCLPRDGDHRPLLLIQGRQAGEERRHMRIGADPEQEHVEGWHAAPVLRLCRSSQPARVPAGGSLRIGPVGPVRPRHRIDKLRPDIHMVEQGSTGASLVPLAVAGGQEPLVTPPDLHPPPVNGIPRRRGGELGEHPRADSAAGQDQGSAPLGRDRVHQPGDQPGGHRLGEQLAIAVNQNLRDRDDVTSWRPRCRRPARQALRRTPRRDRACAAPRRAARRCPCDAGPRTGQARRGGPAWRSCHPAC